MRELRFRLPDAMPPQPGWGVVGIVVHAALIGLLAGTVGRTVIATGGVSQFIQLNPREYALPAISGAAPPPMAEAAEVVESTAAVAADSGARPAVLYAPRVVPVGIPPKTLARHDPVLGTSQAIGLGYGTGRLWVAPLEGRLGVVEPSSDPATHVARVDSAMRARLLAFLDTIPPDSFATPAVEPWVTEVGGKKWGVDGSWVYLGDLKLPTALLALLPLPQGNYQQAQEAAELQRIRQQIIQAAWQAETNADFRRYVRELRERKDREREARGRAEAVEAARKAAARDTIPPGGGGSGRR